MARSKFTTLKTITGRELQVRSNRNQRTWTIKTDSATYKTNPMSKEEFQNSFYSTGNDWQQFLNSNDYYKIK
jgi:arsenate reductase-like glutaredoxin family protein